MKLSIKLFISFLLTFIILTVLMMATVQFYSHRDFSKYVETTEMLRLDELAALLAQEYQADRGWENIRNDASQWRYLLNFFYPPAPGNSVNLPGFPPSADSPHHPPPPHSRADSPHHPPPPPSFRMATRLTLFDSQKRPVIGPATSPKDHTLKQIEVEGRVVGWLGLKKETHLSHPLDLAFLKRQSKVFYTSGVIMLLLASMVAYFLSQHFLAPVRQLAKGTRDLAALRFGTKIDVKTRDELGQLVSDFNTMSKILERYEQMRKQWISDIAYELRTPLAILQGEIEVLQDGLRIADERALESLHAEVLYLAKIIADMHDLSMADSGTFHLNKEPIYCSKVLTETLDRYENRFTENQIIIRRDLAIEAENILRADPTRLKQLFSNLLENVLRYADKPGVLSIRLEMKDKNLEICFQDSGPGVPPSALERLFDRLYRVDVSRARTQGGSGLGLAISKTIVEAHGGEIAAMNVSGGLRIRIVLPTDSNQLTGMTNE